MSLDIHYLRSFLSETPVSTILMGQSNKISTIAEAGKNSPGYRKGKREKGLLAALLAATYIEAHGKRNHRKHVVADTHNDCWKKRE